MNARIVAIAGLLEGSVFSLKGDLSIGRDKTNSISVDDPAMSRRHCVVGEERGQFRVQDLNSRNGTYVNGLQITLRVLQEGDQIKAGESVFLFSCIDPSSSVNPFESEGGVASTLVLQPASDLDFRAEGLASGRTIKNLGVVLKIGSALASIRGLEPLQRKLLKLILEVIPAERGAVLLSGPTPGEFTTYSYGNGPADQPIAVSRHLVDRVLREQGTILSSQVSGEAGADADHSPGLVAPLTAAGRKLGVIYLAARENGAPFQEEHVQLLKGIAGFAGAALENALLVDGLERENHRLRAEANIEHEMVGRSAPMRAVFDFVAKVAPTGATVLIRGESGTGKELVARAVHRNSPRASGPFVAINCAALTEALLESELFGHEKGAFTGAVGLKKGKLEEASGGSVFLDELGELAPALQAKLLRVLQEREFERVGGTRPIKADIRLIAATNRDLEEAVHQGTFRRDLYYRLNVVSLVLPPLRERPEDILPLASHFVRKHVRNSTRTVNGISEEAQACLRSHDWPGNVRELENAIERALVLGSTDLILAEDLPEDVVETGVPEAAPSGGFHELVHDAKKRIVARALAEAGGNYTEAAKRLRLHATNLHRLIRTLKLKDEINRPS